MKKGLLGSTALIGATALIAGTAGAAEAPTWKLTGNANFQVYYVDQDLDLWANGTVLTATTSILLNGPTTTFTVPLGLQDHGWYFGVDESELQLNVSGTADNGLNYGFKIELNANTTDGSAADEVRLQLKGGWGTLQMGDEDGAEDVMNYGGENLMGGPGGFDGDYDDVLLRTTTISTFQAPSFPTIAGDTSDHTKVSYFSPRFAGFQVGGSITPTPSMDGDEFKDDDLTGFEDHIGLGANYDNSFGGVRVRASAVYSQASSNLIGTEDISAYSIGGIVGFGPVSVGANYTDNGDSGQPVGSAIETSYWNVAGSFETGPLYLAAGYMESTNENTIADSTFSMLSFTADYSVAPGLGVYAEIDLVEDEQLGGLVPILDNDATIFIAGVNISF